MLLRTPVALSIVGWVLLGNAGAAQQHPSFKTLQDVDAFTQTYYQKPRPELIASLIEALYSSGLTQRPNAAPPYIGFFSEVFLVNPEHVSKWEAVVGKQDTSVRQILWQALAI